MPEGENHHPLTERQLEILKLVAQGATNKEIGRALDISEHTVRKHLQNIFEKLDVSSRTEAAARAFQEGWITLPGAHAVAPSSDSAVAEAPPTRVTLNPRLLLGAGGLFVIVVVLLAVLVFSRNGVSSQQSNPSGMGGNRWRQASPLPVPRAGLAGVVHGGRIYAIAGESKDGVTGMVTRFDPTAGDWTVLSGKPTPVRDVGAGVLGGRIYVPGGCLADGSPTDVLEIYDPTADVWERGPRMPQPLCAYAIAAWEGKLYLFGGWDGTRYVKAVWVYDPERKRWDVRTPMPTARGYAGAAAVEDQIYVIGGYDGRRDLAVVEVYAPAQDGGQGKPWTKAPSLPEGRAAPGVVAVRSKLYVIGGGWERGYSTAEQYDVFSKQWAAFPAATPGLWRNMAVVTVDTLGETRIYAFGGWNGDFVASNWVVTVLYNVILPLQQR